MRKLGKLKNKTLYYQFDGIMVMKKKEGSGSVDDITESGSERIRFRNTASINLDIVVQIDSRF